MATWVWNQKRLSTFKKTFETIHKNAGIPREDYELIVTNNGGLPEHQALLAEQDIDILQNFGWNVGAHIAHNENIKKASGKWLVMAADDLEFEPDWLKVGLEMAEKYEEKKLIPNLSWPRGLRIAKSKTGELDGCVVLSHTNNCWIWLKSLADEYYLKYGFFRTNYKSDGEYTLQLNKDGWNFIMSKKQMIIHLARSKGSTCFSTLGSWTQWADEWKKQEQAAEWWRNHPDARIYDWKY